MNYIKNIIIILVLGYIISGCEVKDNCKYNEELSLPYHSAVVCIKGYSYFYGFSEHEKKLEQLFITDINGNKYPIQCNINRSQYVQQ